MVASNAHFFLTYPPALGNGLVRATVFRLSLKLMGKTRDEGIAPRRARNAAGASQGNDETPPRGVISWTFTITTTTS
jgi:hypothetical protein